MRKGFFITLEGPDGSGKSTQIKFLKKYFEEKNIDVVFTREPGGTEIGEKIREIILDRNNSEMSDKTETLLYAASRAQHVDQFIRPALEAGKIVICDRFVDSSFAYQGYGRGIGDWVLTVNDFAVGDCMPDVTILMELDPEVGRDRISADSFDRLEQERIEFHKRVYDGYKHLARENPERFVEVDANSDKKAISEKIEKAIEDALKDRGIICH